MNYILRGRKKEFFALLIFIFSIFSGPARASIIFPKTTDYNGIPELVAGVTNWVLSLTAGIVMIFLIVGGIYYITAAGDEKQMEKAKEIIKYAIAGLFAVLISYSVITTLNKIIFG